MKLLLQAAIVIAVTPAVLAGNAPQATAAPPPLTLTAQAADTVDGGYGFVAKVDVGAPGEGGRSCSGALVAPRWVLSAKACFAVDGQPAPADAAPKQDVRVTVGRARLNAETGHRVAAARVVLHAERDVALVQLAAAVTDVAPVQIAATAPTPGETLQVAGYGRTAAEWIADRLHTDAFTVSDVAATTVGITAAANAVGPCKGDAGGPGLRVEGTTISLVAVNHSGAQGGCNGAAADAAHGGIQTRVDDLGGWISAQVAESTVNVLLDNYSNLCLGIGKGSTDKGAEAIQWGCNGATDQDWRISAGADGAAEIRNDRSNLCLGIGKASKDKGAPVIQWTCNGKVDQRWILQPGTDGLTRLRNVNSGLCIGIGAGSKEAGGQAIQWSCGQANIDQDWRIKARTDGRSVHNAHSGLCLGVTDLTRGAKAVQDACDSNNEHRWYLRAVGNYVQIANERTGFCLGISKASTDKDTAAIQWTCSNAADQQWDLQSSGDGQFQLRNRNSNLCLGIPRASQDPGVNLIQRDCSDATNQNWRL